MRPSVIFQRGGFTVALVAALAAHGQCQEWARQIFEKKNHDFGVVARGADVKYRFKVVNPYAETVHISNVRTSCGCSSAKMPERTLKPGGATYLEVAMDTRRFMRLKQSSVIVQIDAPRFAEVRLPLKAYIRTDVVFSPGSASFGAVEQGTSAERTVGITYAGRNNWSIDSIKSSNKFVSAKVVLVARGQGHVKYNLVVQIQPDAPAGVLRDHITLVTNDANNPYVPVAVTARIEADITVTPSFLSLGRLAPGQTKTTNVVLRGRKKFSIDKLECESDQQAFKVRLPQEASNVHVLPLTFTAPDAPGEFNDLLTLTIAGRPQPIVFRATGTIVATSTN